MAEDWRDVGRPTHERRVPWREPGHDAESPERIPARGWWQVLVRVAGETGRDNIMVVAAGCAFYALLALFPFITALVSIYGLVADPSTVANQLGALKDVLPAEAYGIIEGQVKAVVSTSNSALGFGTVVALGLALWSASAGIKTVFSSLNIAYEEAETRSFLRFNATALAFTLLTVLAIVAGILVIVGLPVLLAWVPLGRAGAWLVSLVSWAMLLVFITFGIGLLYRFGPSRRPANWRWLTPGALFATLLWVAASMGFSFYAANFASYNETYGALGGVIVTMMWLWITALIVLMGAELNSELELQTAEDTTVGEDRPMGWRGSYVADHTAKDHRADTEEPAP
ncbi:MAG: YihY/virulence factor BrkB family protein [Geminicoccaceae bacterium]|nr:YihY/virulence factor BrkB family protein [Geminicoccaceae bacterium]